jgi:hypothetical protein
LASTSWHNVLIPACKYSAWSCDMQSNQHTVSVRWLLILNWTFRVKCYVLSKKNATYWWKSIMHCGTIVLILQSCHNPPAFCAHFTVKIHLSEVPFDVCILLLKLCMWFVLKGDWAISSSGNTHTTYCWIPGNSIRG